MLVLNKIALRSWISRQVKFIIPILHAVQVLIRTRILSRHIVELNMMIIVLVSILLFQYRSRGLQVTGWSRNIPWSRDRSGSRRCEGSWPRTAVP